MFLGLELFSFLAAPFPCVYASEPREVLVGLGGRRAAALCSVRKLYSYYDMRTGTHTHRESKREKCKISMSKHCESEIQTF